MDAHACRCGGGPWCGSLVSDTLKPAPEAGPGQPAAKQAGTGARGAGPIESVAAAQTLYGPLLPPPASTSSASLLLITRGQALSTGALVCSGSPLPLLNSPPQGDSSLDAPPPSPLCASPSALLQLLPPPCSAASPATREALPLPWSVKGTAQVHCRYARRHGCAAVAPEPDRRAVGVLSPWTLCRCPVAWRRGARAHVRSASISICAIVSFPFYLRPPGPLDPALPLLRIWPSLCQRCCSSCAGIRWDWTAHLT